MSAAPVLRLSVPEDTAQLKTLWKLVFQDEDRLIEAFFDCLYAPGRAVVALQDGELVSAAYLVPGVEIWTSGGVRQPAVYFYALATLPDRRGAGLGGAVTDACIALAAQRGEDLCLMPADERLRVWYTSRCGLRSLGTAKELEFSASECAANKGIGLRTVSSAEYGAIRETLLAGVPHAALPEAFFRFQASLCGFSGGALLALETPEGWRGLACAELEGDCVRIPELLWPGAPDVAAAAIMRYFSAVRCSARMPGGNSPTVVSASPPAERLWWGPVFD